MSWRKTWAGVGDSAHLWSHDVTYAVIELWLLLLLLLLVLRPSVLSSRGKKNNKKLHNYNFIICIIIIIIIIIINADLAWYAGVGHLELSGLAADVVQRLGTLDVAAALRDLRVSDGVNSDDDDHTQQ